MNEPPSGPRWFCVVLGHTKIENWKIYRWREIWFERSQTTMHVWVPIFSKPGAPQSSVVSIQTVERRLPDAGDAP